MTSWPVNRVKNNLQTISSLLNFQSRYTQDPQTLGMFRDSQNRIRSMALVHEYLYQAPDLTNIDFAAYVHTLTDYLCRSYGVHADVMRRQVEADVALDIDTAIPCGLIINALVSNALKYAFPAGQAGEIRIALLAHDANRLTLVVGDNGVGLPPALDLEHTTSLGLRLVRILAQQLEGTVEMRHGTGVEFRITFAWHKSRARR